MATAAAPTGEDLVDLELGFEPAAVTVEGLAAEGYRALPGDGIGGTVMVLVGSDGSEVDHRDGLPARVEFDDLGVIASMRRVAPGAGLAAWAVFDSGGQAMAMG